MIKIAGVKLYNHPVLGNLELDFCDNDGKPVDTVIIAGENGTGKSNLLNFLYGVASLNNKYECEIFVENDGIKERWKYKYEDDGHLWVLLGGGIKTLQGAGDLEKKYNLNGIFSDVGINFNSDSISNVTSMSLDAEGVSRRSGGDWPKSVKQLIIDVQAMDDATISSAVKNNPNVPYNELNVEQRMERFTKAFNRIFEDLKYDRVDNINNEKAIIFKKGKQDVLIDELSSGEKQIVFRGCFLLKDVNALNGALVFIDEPEISLHPVWQKKILDYYKRIFMDASGKQTSQIFAVTHSPFVIHNDNRINDKVIILKRNNDGNIVAADNKEFYSCDSLKAVEDAFHIHDFSGDKPTVYLEGRTDEKYFNKTIEVFGLNPQFRFKWIGYIDKNGQEVFTGKDSIQKAYQFLIAQKPSVINVCLKDTDTKTKEENVKNTYMRVMPYYENCKAIKVGIENALVLDEIDTTNYYKQREQIGDMGEQKIIQEFEKMSFCNHICSLDNNILREVLRHLKEEIDTITSIYENA